MSRRPISGMDIDTHALGEYLETLGVALQQDNAVVKDIHEDRDIPGAEEELEIRFGITFTPCDGVELGSGVPYEPPEVDE